VIDAVKGFLRVTRVRIGVLGAGAWGKNHVRTISGMADAELYRRGRCKPGVGRSWPGSTRRVDHGRSAKVIEQSDAVIVATPARTHAALAMQAMEAGRATLVEKPFALTVADAERMADLAARKGVPLLVGHLLEYHRWWKSSAP
jgi:predicted dehydrogenase